MPVESLLWFCTFQLDVFRGVLLLMRRVCVHTQCPQSCTALLRHRACVVLRVAPPVCTAFAIIAARAQPGASTRSPPCRQGAPAVGAGGSVGRAPAAGAPRRHGGERVLAPGCALATMMAKAAHVGEGTRRTTQTLCRSRAVHERGHCAWTHMDAHAPHKQNNHPENVKLESKKPQQRFRCLRKKRPSSRKRLTSKSPLPPISMLGRPRD